MKSAYIKYLAALLLFGSNGVVASRIPLASYEIVFFRTMIGGFFLAFLFLMSGKKPAFWRQKSQFWLLAGSGAAMGASWMFLYEAYRQIGVSVASLAYYCGPVLVAVLSPVLFREKLTAAKIAGFAAVVCGLFLVNGQALREGNPAWGLFCGGMSAVLYAAMVILNKKVEKITGLENSMFQLLFGFITVACFFIAKQGAVPAVEGNWAPVLILGLVNTGVGCYLYFSSIGSLPVQTVAICGYLEPLSALLFFAFFLGEALQSVQIAGAALILGGAVFGEAAAHKAVRQ